MFSYFNLGSRPPLLEGCPRPIEELMINCWDPVPNKRPSMAYVVSVMKTLCEFFTGSDVPILYNDNDDEVVSYLNNFVLKFT